MPSLSEEKSSAYLAQQELLLLLSTPSSSVTEDEIVQGRALNALTNCDDDSSSRQLTFKANIVNLFIADMTIDIAIGGGGWRGARFDDTDTDDRWRLNLSTPLLIVMCDGQTQFRYSTIQHVVLNVIRFLDVASARMFQK